jgi:hypothetical protein
MTAHHDLDQQLTAFLRDGPDELPGASFDSVRDRTDRTSQRVVIGPWRAPTLNKIVPIGLGAAAVIGVLFLGSQFMGSPSSNVGGPASQPPATVAPSEAPASAPPASAVPSPISASALTQIFTSTVHGISVSYPEGWIIEPATGPWTDGPNSHSFNNPQDDRLFGMPITMDELFLNIASQPIGDAAPEDWTAEQMAEWESTPGCTATEPIAVDGATGLIGSEGCDLAVVTTDGRGYWISLRTNPDGGSVVAPFDRAWFEEVLATVQLHPEDAVDVAPSATP